MTYTAARCGATTAHGGHRWIAGTWCAGNVDVIVGVPARDGCGNCGSRSHTFCNWPNGTGALAGRGTCAVCGELIGNNHADDCAEVVRGGRVVGPSR